MTRRSCVGCIAYTIANGGAWSNTKKYDICHNSEALQLTVANGRTRIEDSIVRPLVQEVATQHTPESLVETIGSEPGLVLLRTGLFDSYGGSPARYSFVASKPFLTLRSQGSRCQFRSQDGAHEQFGNPWHVLNGLMSRYELLEEVDLPFPLGGCFGYWGYDLKNFVEPHLPRKAINDLELPDCCVGFYDSLVVFDHRLDKAWVVSTGSQMDGSRSEKVAQERAG